MPLSDPQIGEVWSTTDAVSGRDIQGILAELAPARAVFVSLSGQRFPVTRSRLGSSWISYSGDMEADGIRLKVA